jgi:hypothetical protein
VNVRAILGILLLFLASFIHPIPAEERGVESHDPFFETEVWPKVGERTCLNCHAPRGDAAESKFLLEDPALHVEYLAHNRQAFVRMAQVKKDGVSRILLKASGKLDHGGGAQLKTGSSGYRVLERFVGGLEGTPNEAGAAPAPRPFFDGVQMATPRRLLRRVTLSLAGRLPTPDEESEVDRGGEKALEPALDRILTEDAYYDRLAEGFNDIFLTLGYMGNADDALSYDHFEKTRHWYQNFDLTHVPEKERQKAGYKLADDYRKALLHEPLELIKYIVRNDRPFTEIVTADYVLVSPYSARGYGIFESLKDRFTNPEDPFEYIPARIPALKGRDGRVQKTEAGLYPSAGILSMFQYLRRYPTTVTNRNRLRARMYYRHFLGIDVMKLAPRVADAAAVAAKFSNPPFQAPECVVCHKTIDPVAGLFQDYFNEEGHYGPRKEGWFTDMFAPGREGRDLSPQERWRALQWLGEETVKDPRFASAMVEHVYYILMGRKVLEPPQDIDEPLFAPRRRAYDEERRMIRDIARRFAQGGFNLKSVFKALIATPFYRVDGLSEAVKDPARRAELDDVGLVRLLTPEALERKVRAVFGFSWGRLKDSDQKFAILYGGIDSKEVTERNGDPSGAMGAIQRIMANDVACKAVAKDFGLVPEKRRLFPDIEPGDLPDPGPDSEGKILRGIVHLHRVVLGREHSPSHPEVLRTYALFRSIVEEARSKKGLSPQESYFCRGQENKREEDPKYTIRAWRAVVTYLLRQDDFLYE